MRRAVFTLGVVAGLAAPAAAQWLGQPVWNSPTGGGLTVSADYARPNSDYSGGTASTVTAAGGAVVAAPDGHEPGGQNP